MCGLAGVISNIITHQEKKVFTNLLSISHLRGAHSTGLIQVGTGPYKIKVEDRKVELISSKYLGPSPVYVRTKEYDELMKEPQQKAILGHCRHATVGSVTVDNCHPFSVNHITGMHNGTIYNNAELLDKQMFDTDSEALFHSIQHHGVEEALAKVKHGAYAISYVNEEDETVNLVRNEKRTLFFARSGQDVYYASEEGMLAFILGRANVTHDKIQPLEPYHHISFSISPGVNPAEDYKIVKFKKPVVSYHSYTYPRNKLKVTKVWDYSKKSEKTNVVPFNPEQDERDYQEWHTSQNTAKKDDMYEGYKGKKYTAGEMDALLGAGCCYCNSTPELLDFDKVIFIEEDLFLCDCEGREHLPSDKLKPKETVH